MGRQTRSAKLPANKMEFQSSFHSSSLARPRRTGKKCKVPKIDDRVGPPVPAREGTTRRFGTNPRLVFPRRCSSAASEKGTKVLVKRENSPTPETAIGQPVISQRQSADFAFWRPVSFAGSGRFPSPNSALAFYFFSFILLLVRYSYWLISRLGRKEKKNILFFSSLISLACRHRTCQSSKSMSDFLGTQFQK